MRLKFEQLEQRLALSGLGAAGWDCPEFPDGPTIPSHLDRLMDSFEGGRVIGAASAMECRETVIFLRTSYRQFVDSVAPAGDVNQDGFHDVHVTFISEQTQPEDPLKIVLERTRYTFLAGTSLPDEVIVEDQGEVLSALPDLHWEERWWSSTWNPPNGFGEFKLDVDREFPIPVNIGDIDGDGFEDRMRRGASVWFVGTAVIDFGPDFRDSFLLPGIAVRDIDQNGDPCAGCERPFYPLHAGPLGDINGDGYGDFFVLAQFMGLDTIDVFTGRDFGRDLPADIDGSGLVEFADFLVLAYNYGNENVTRSEGDLDGDGLVALSDFIVLRDTFGHSKADVPLLSG